MLVPAGIAALLTLVMYIGEMCLLDGHLYRFGWGFIFDGIDGIVLAPIDILIVILAGGVSAVICGALNRKKAL